MPDNKMLELLSYRKRYGITEQYWNSLSEDKKLFWKMVTWGAAFFSSLMITKTGVKVFDWALIGFSTLTAFLIIESQRNLGRYKNPILRKRLMRVTVAFGVTGVTLLGLTIFTLFGYILAKVLFFISIDRPLVPMSRLEDLLTVLALSIAFAISLFKTFREKHFEEIIYGLPFLLLKILLVARLYIAKSFFPFAFFELFVVLLAYFYSSTFATVIKPFIDFSKIQ